jgi:rhodanese-related sulfurtransferase
MINTKQILEFIQNNWMLCAAFGAILVMLLFEELKNKIGGISKISVQNCTLLLNRENAVTVDLRNQETFASGHIIGSINLMHASFDDHIKKLKTHKNTPLILVDETDTSATKIGVKLQKQGFARVYILAGGLQAWKKASLPLTKN